MIIARTTKEARSNIMALRTGGRTLGLVPTMGYLHDGHLALIKASKKACSLTAVSIFVNPMQFGPGEDLYRYPRDLDGDIAKLEEAGVDLLFAPEAADMYPAGSSTFVTVDGLETLLCGEARPALFKGVATVVCKLFNIFHPERAFFGAKDFQQTVIIRRLVADLDFDVRVDVVPTVREKDGLAISSRNSYLRPNERALAPYLYTRLAEGAADLEAGKVGVKAATGRIERELSDLGFIIEYVCLFDPETLQPVKTLRGPAVLAVAARIGRTRLIDNVPVHPKEEK